MLEAEVIAERKSVVVIGAGIAGLVTATVLREDGFDVTVLEKEPAVGGVWVETRTYRTVPPGEAWWPHGCIRTHQGGSPDGARKAGPEMRCAAET